MALLTVIALCSPPTRLLRRRNGDDASVTTSLNELQSEVRELKELVQQLKQETTASRAEMTRLRQELESERAEQSLPTSDNAADQVDVRVGHLEDEQQIALRQSR